MSPLYASGPIEKAGGPRLLLDLSTSLAWRGRHPVEIVRAEREIAARLLNDRDLCVVPVVYHDYHLRALEPALARNLVSSALALAPPSVSTRGSDPRLDLPNISPDAASNKGHIARLIQPAAKIARQLARLLLAAVPERSREEVRQSLIHARQAMRQLLYTSADAPLPTGTRKPTTVLLEEPIPDLTLIVYPQKTDVLFLSGLGWDVLDWQRLSVLRAESGMRIVSMIYDLVPIRFPAFLRSCRIIFRITFSTLSTIATLSSAFQNVLNRTLSSLSLKTAGPRSRQ